MNAVLPGTEIRVDEDGHLLDPGEWTPAVAEELADLSGLRLDERHWEIIRAVREFHARYHRSPTTRPLLKHLALCLGPEKAGSVYVMQLFGGGTPARTISRIAGLPKPPNCI
jgi:tRNA 2-thiouridine synthesizing protein E